MNRNNFVVNAPKHLLPNYRISPFSTEDIRLNKIISENEAILKNFDFLNFNKNYIITKNGRDAIFKSLKLLKLKKDDVVTIVTTSNNYYISSCVTNEIEKICKWSREIISTTKVIFVNHEFGWCYEDLINLKKHNLPIIEDCALSLFSNTSDNLKGLIGDFVICSLSKFFPIQEGGILYYSPIYKDTIDDTLTLHEKKYINSIINFYIKEISIWNLKRINNYQYLEREIKKLGFKSRFQLLENTIPGVYMFTIDSNIDLQRMKIFMQHQGIECSVFYGEKSFFLPIHHRLEFEDLDYFIECIKVFWRKTMKVKNIILGENVEISENTHINNVKIGNDVKLSRNCTIFGSENNIANIGDNTYFAMNNLINGFYGVEIGKNCSFGPNVTILTDSGPNRSEKLQKLYPLETGKVTIGDDCWIGMNSMIINGVTIGECSIVGAGSFVKDSFPSYSLIAGNPAKRIKDLREKLCNDDDREI